MAAPFAHEDLEKLKKFIEFVSANPLVLNMPQLDFVRKFIEQFGGTIPVGDFQMPAGGGKCPFGGDAKAESKPAPGPEQNEAPEEMLEEEESEESELELDMEETNVQLFEPNVLYIQEKPPKIVKKKINPLKKARTKMLAKRKKVVTKEPSTPAAKVKKSKLSPPNVLTVKEELVNESEESSGYDPLYTANVEIKMEYEAEHIQLEGGKKPVVPYYTNDDTVDTDDKYDSSAGDDADYGAKLERELADKEEAENDEDTTNDEEEDEPLIMLAKRRGRARKYRRREVGKIKAPSAVICRETCQQHCAQKFSEAQRLRTHDYFWSLSKEHRLDYIRKHILAKRYKRLYRKKLPSRDNNCYFLHDSDGSESEQMKRVCRKYFEATLRVNNHSIQKALEGYKPAPLPVIKALTHQEREERQNAFSKRAKEIRQVLDPETGNLVTIDPNAKEVKSPDTAPKKKRVRRKAGDPMPEHIPKPIKCEERCIFKCHIQFTEEERTQICNLFWSLDYKRRKDFVLTRIETKEVETQVAPEFRKSNKPPRSFQTRCFLRSGINGVNKRVCKHFMMSTLCISHKFIQNALQFADKITGSYTGADRRGLNTAPNKSESSQTIINHISSYPTWVPNKKSKTRYLHYKLSIKQMYMDYKNMSIEQQKKFVSSQGYYKSFHENFRLSFLFNPDPKRRGGFLRLNPNISHYSGNEPGGFWMDPNGEKLDTSSSMTDLTQNCMRFHRSIEQETLPASTAAGLTPGDDSLCTTTASPTLVTASSASTSSFSLNQPLSYAHFMDPSTLAVLNAGGLCQPSSAVVRHDFNPNLYDSSFVQAQSSTSSSAVFRRL